MFSKELTYSSPPIPIRNNYCGTYVHIVTKQEITVTHAHGNYIIYNIDNRPVVRHITILETFVRKGEVPKFLH